MSNVIKLAYDAARSKPAAKSDPLEAVETFDVFQRIAYAKPPQAAAARAAADAAKMRAENAIVQARADQRTNDVITWRAYREADAVTRAHLRQHHGASVERGRALDTDPPEPPKDAA